MTDHKIEKHVDVLIVGAGLSGIGTAYWLQKKCPKKSYVILEARDTLGGTWDLFRYPGIRSDSDMFTFGFRFKPWQNPQSLSAGPDILKYLTETALENGISNHILYNHRVISSDWSSKELCWTVTVLQGEQTLLFKANFLYMCSGYYSYEEAHRPKFEDEEKFQGNMVIPQFWPKDLDYSGKKVVIIGSGATAITLVPAMVEGGAAHVTMLQRSPTYVMNLPNHNGMFRWLKKYISEKVAYKLTRWRNLSLTMLLFALSKAFPNVIKSLIMKGAAKQLPKEFPVEKHFNPAYKPWDQRLCVVPDGDLFRVIKQGKASVVTDHISCFTEKGILTHSGEQLDADIIVVATGLKVRLLGGALLSMDGIHPSTNQFMVYRGMMASDVPNLALAFGYTNASWTLKTDLTANYVCKLLNYMDKHGYKVVVPRKEKGVTEEPFLDFDAGYIKRAENILPKQGSRRPWRVYQNYFMDMLTTRFGRVNDGVLEFKA